MDFLSKIEQKSTAVLNVFRSSEPSVVFQHIARFIPGKIPSKCKSFIAAEDGTPSTNICQHKSLFRSHLSKVMDGVTMSFRRCVDAFRQDVCHANHIHNTLYSSVE
eukprot:2933744-Karenia_brevis.AAC.1